MAAVAALSCARLAHGVIVRDAVYVTVWVVLEESRDLIRADAIVSITAVPAEDEPAPADWARTHPAKRLHPSKLAKVVVATAGGVRGSVITCPGRNVHQVISELVVLLDRLVAEQQPEKMRFLRGRWHNWLTRDKHPWTVFEELPEPEWAYR